jgi:hypothetical protein
LRAIDVRSTPQERTFKRLIMFVRFLP